jgi:N-acetylglucosamine-6-phosphate deacetylase
VSLLPTIVTDVHEVMERAADAAIAAHGRNGIRGIHIEGPHISVQRKGAHNPALIRSIDERTFSLVSRLRAARIPVLLTLAPECVPPGTIARLCGLGVVVSIGHTAGDAGTTRAAIVEGAMSATHLYNAMAPMTARAPGVVGAILDSDVYVGFIADGHHLDDQVLRLAIRSRPRSDRMVLVSDAMPTWNGPDWFELYGERISLKDGKLVTRISSLAGVHFDMGSSVQRLVRIVGIDRDAALRMATSVPARMMGLEAEIGTLRPGTRADIVLLDEALAVRAVITA